MGLCDREEAGGLACMLAVGPQAPLWGGAPAAVGAVQGSEAVLTLVGTCPGLGAEADEEWGQKAHCPCCVTEQMSSLETV